jgi:CsoR family transcriptional regulator, copper-sensing transcriptional repressor
MVVHGYNQEKAAQLARLREIEGHVRGLRRMIGEDAYCIDILDHVSRIEGALRSVALCMVDQRVRRYVEAAPAPGDEAEAHGKLAESSQAIERLVRL